ncbi:MAG: AAA family ATPase [Pigmentiphaga sp.]|uniref:AAA family ATPase n=1 Tax=Pigmentiphaga sp. TaxID=1977564 RepID=UPI0029B33E12|nr:AAA family ATPase [Pigmentiphaga sp.]MDX3907694.1 AAA family ATPase [Pigmentiphaga sp.]
MSQVIHYATPEDGVELIRADDVPSRASDWLMKGCWPEGELVILGGNGGSGKTLIAMDLVATLSNSGTRCGKFPDGTPARHGAALIWSCEDDWQRTLMPRLDAAGANFRHIFFVGDVIEFSSRRSFDFKRDLPGLIRRIEEIGDVRLLVIDTVMEVISGGGASAKKVRQDLLKLVEIAHKYRITVIGIAHLVKDAKKGDLVKSLAGSQAFSNLARHVLIAMRVNIRGQGLDDPSVGVLTCAKSNLSKAGGGWLYEIHPAWVQAVDGREIETSRLIWHRQMLPGSAEEIRDWATAEKSEMAASPRNRAEEFLVRFLADGPVPASEVHERAGEDGITPKMLRTARERLGVVSTRVSGDRPGESWNEWSLPETDREKEPFPFLDPDYGHAGQPGQAGQPRQAEEPKGAHEATQGSKTAQLFDAFMGWRQGGPFNS